MAEGLGFTSYIVDNDKAFAEALAKLEKVTDDFRIPLVLIGKDFYRSQRIIFQLKSEGKYQDLAPAPGLGGNPTTTSNYKARKQRLLGFTYPILVGRTRRLSESTLSNTAANSIYRLGSKSLILGTNVAWGIYHQSDEPRKRIPQRKFMFITGGPNETAQDSRITGRIERWTLLIDNYVKQIVEGKV